MGFDRIDFGEEEKSKLVEIMKGRLDLSGIDPKNFNYASLIYELYAGNSNNRLLFEIDFRENPEKLEECSKKHGVEMQFKSLTIYFKNSSPFWKEF